MNRTPVHVLCFLALALAALFACSEQAPQPTSDVAAAPPTVPIPQAPAILRVPQPREVSASPDPRTADELAQAACRSPDGAWHCGHVKPKPIVRAFGAGPVIPSSWTVPAWFVDPQNASAAANDSNSCTTSGAPCLTWHQINDVRWGCQGTPAACPRLRQNTTITFLSSQSGNTDPVYTRLAEEAGAFVQFTGPLGSAQQTGTGAISGVTAKNRATPQLLQATMPAGCAVGNFVVNATHASRAWVFKNVSGSTFALTQPLTAVALPQTYNASTEVNTWANTDSVTCYAPVMVDLVDVEPLIVDWNGGFDNKLAIYNVTALSPTIDSTLQVNSSVDFAEASSQRWIFLNASALPASFVSTPVWVNADLVPGAGGGLPMLDTNNLQTFVNGGAIGSPTASGGFAGNRLVGAAFDNDTILSAEGAAGLALGSCQFGTTYLDSTTNPFTITGISLMQSLGGFGATVLWGPGTLNNAAQFAYPTGAGNAAASLKVSLLSKSQNKVCLVAPGAASGFGTCNLTLSPAQLDTSLGGTTGCLTTGGGGSYCNYGP